MKVRQPELIVQEESDADREIDILMGPGCCPDCDRNQSAWDEYQARALRGRRDPEAQQAWKHYLLAGRTMAEWIGQMGTPVQLGIHSVPDGWPYVRLDGQPLDIREQGALRLANPPLDPGELCRSVTTDDECWLFTCECSERCCGGIDSPVHVVHHDGYTLWLSPERPQLPLALFETAQYRHVILMAMGDLLKDPPQYSGLNWSMGISPEGLRRALDMADKGMAWHGGLPSTFVPGDL